jgi:hypothetical protein
VQRPPRKIISEIALALGTSCILDDPALPPQYTDLFRAIEMELGGRADSLRSKKMSFTPALPFA